MLVPYPEDGSDAKDHRRPSALRNKAARRAKGEHMLESEAIKTAICCFSSQSSHITSSFRLPTKTISARLLPYTILNYTFIPLPPRRPCSACAESSSSSLWLIRETHLGRVLATLLIHPGYASICRPAPRRRECEGKNKTTTKNNRALPRLMSLTLRAPSGA